MSFMLFLPIFEVSVKLLNANFSAIMVICFSRIENVLENVRSFVFSLRG